MAMARATSGPAYPERFYAAASYAGFDGSESSAKNVSSKFSNDTALLLYALYQQVKALLFPRSPTSRLLISRDLVVSFV